MASNPNDQKIITMTLDFRACGDSLRSAAHVQSQSVGHFELSLTMANREEQREAVRRIKGNLDQFLKRNKDLIDRDTLYTNDTVFYLRRFFESAVSAVFSNREVREDADVNCTMSLNGKVLGTVNINQANRPF